METKSVTPEQIDELLGFLPLFDKPGRAFVENWRGSEEATGGSITLLYPVYLPDVVEFFRLASQAWWSDQNYVPGDAVVMFENEDTLRLATIAQIRTLLTYCARGERFSDGHWEAVLQPGRVVALLRRLEIIRSEMQRSREAAEQPTPISPMEKAVTNSPTQFEVGREYSRAEISAALGGSRQLYLPTNDGRVVCGCFKTTPRYNPGAPTVVTFGPGRIVKQNAEVVSQQAEPIPVFLFQGGSAWRYVGRYRCSRLSRDEAVLRNEMEANPARGPISGVLYFERVGD